MKKMTDIKKIMVFQSEYTFCSDKDGFSETVSSLIIWTDIYIYKYVYIV